MAKTVAVSGGFDPLNADHIRLFEGAAKYGAVIVILNSDDWLMRKKGYYHQSWHDRAHIIQSLRYVTTVVSVDDRDGTVCEALKRVSPDYFANGGDRRADNTPEVRLCAETGVEMLWSVGSWNVHHSSILMKKSTVFRPWGYYTVIDDGAQHRVKRLCVMPGKATSVQRHLLRREILVPLAGGDVVDIPNEQWHTIVADERPLEFIEVQLGNIWESDIERDENSSGYSV